MEPIVLVGAIIVIFGFWQEVRPVLQQVYKALATSSALTKLAAGFTAQTPSYQANTWLERKAG